MNIQENYYISICGMHFALDTIFLLKSKVLCTNKQWKPDLSRRCLNKFNIEYNIYR